LYEAKAFRSVLAEIVRFVTAQETAHRVLYHEDIDLTKMNNLAKVEEEQQKTDTYLMQSNKSTRKVTGIFIIHPRLLLETTMMKKSLTETVLLSFTNLKPVCESIFKNAADRFPTGINIVGFSQENFKRFYKLPKVRLTDCLYNVAFGDLNFTDLGKTCLPESVRKEIQKLYTKEKHHTSLLGTSFHF
jgi:hypothetical protein